MAFPEELKKQTPKKNNNWVKYVAIGVAVLFMGGSLYMASYFQQFSEGNECTPEGTFWLVMLKHGAGNITASDATKEKVAKVVIPEKENRSLVETIKFGVSITRETPKILPNLMRVCEQYQKKYEKECPLKVAGVTVPNKQGSAKSFGKLFKKHIAASELPVDLDNFTLEQVLSSLDGEGQTLCEFE